jgi:2-hydroxy-6-oxonona-2,4-dienedioate hydrolase
MTLTEEGIIHVPGLLSRWVQLGDGQRAHYMTAGETGPAVILLHGGIPGSSGVAGWRLMAPLLAANGYRVFCPDQPGFGLSDNSERYWPVHGPYTHVDFINRFADALCLDEFYLSGNSMGCINTAHYVVRYPHRVKAFVLIAGPVGDLVRFEAEKDLKVPVGWDTGNRERMKVMMRSIIHHDEAITDDLLDMRMASADNHKLGWEAWQRVNNFGEIDHDVALALSTTGKLDQLETPGICLYGMNDAILPAEELGYAVEDVLPKVQFFYPEDCGHQGQTDQPELFNEVFTEFFQTGKVSRATADKAGVSKRRAELPDLVEQA